MYHPCIWIIYKTLFYFNNNNNNNNVDYETVNTLYITIRIQKSTIYLRRTAIKAT